MITGTSSVILRLIIFYPMNFDSLNTFEKNQTLKL